MNRQVEDFRLGVGLEGLDMVNPKCLDIQGRMMLLSSSCLLQCGEIFDGDLVALSGRRLGRVHGFWAEKQTHLEGPVDRSANIAVEMSLFACVSNDGNTWSMDGTHRCFTVASEIIAPNCVGKPWTRMHSSGAAETLAFGMNRAMHSDCAPFDDHRACTLVMYATEKTLAFGMRKSRLNSC